MATKRKVVRRTPGKGGGRVAAGRTRPDVILDVDCERGLLFLVLRNIGDDLACRVSVKFSPELVGLGGDRIDRKSTRLNSSHSQQSRMPSSA